MLVVREAGGAGWKAAVDGEPVPIARADRGHMAVSLPSGAHRVTLDYQPPLIRAGSLIALAGGLVVLGLALAPRRVVGR